MQIRYLFVILFIGWCGSTKSQQIQRVIIDTNAWSEPVNLFDHLINENKKNHPSNPTWTYADVWKDLDSRVSIDSFLSGILSANQMKTFSRGILFAKRILDLKKDRPQVEIDVPVFVYNELTNSLTSKIGSQSKPPGRTINYDEFFRSMPIRTHVGTGNLVAGHDYPTKQVGAKPADLKTAMTTFFRDKVNNVNSGGNHQELIQLIDYLGKDVDIKRGKTHAHLKVLKELSENVRAKKQVWDDQLKVTFPSVNEFKDFNSETSRLFPAATKIIAYADSMDTLRYTNPTEMIIDRLLKSKEEFDIFDLKIYLYAKKENAPIMTFNTQAFQEVNDPTFLNFFEETKILMPDINFKSSIDLDRSFCKDVLAASIQNDFVREAAILTSLGQVKTLSQNNIDLTEFHQLFSKIIGECSGSTGVNFRVKLTERPIFQMVDMLVKVNGDWKIDQNVAFSSDSNGDISERANALKFIQKEVLNRELTINDFHLLPPTIVQQPNLLKSKHIVHALENGRKDGARTLGFYLEKLKLDIKPDMVAYGLVLHILSTFIPQSIDAAIVKFNTNPATISFRNCPPGGWRITRSIDASCALHWDDIDRINDEREFRRDPKKAKINSDEFIKYLQTVEDPLKRQQLCQFVEQLIETAEPSATKVIGKSVPEVNQIVNRNKIVDHFSKVREASGALNSGVFAKNILADFLRGNMKDVAVNIGFLAGDHALGKIARLAEVKGAAFVTSGKLMIGNAFKIASPFVKRLGSAFVVFDLVEQIKALQQGDRDAIVRVVGDGIIIGIDVIETGISIAEVAGVISGASAVTGPIGLTIGAVCLVGTEIFFVAKHVEELDKVLHLSLEEKIVEGLGSLFHSPSGYLAELKEVKQANNQLAEDAMKFLKKQEHVQKYVVPAARFNYQTNRADITDSLQVRVADRLQIRWARSRPDDPAGGKVFCATQDDSGEVPPAGTTHMCLDAIGIADLTEKTDPVVLFNLYQPFSVVEGFPNISNVFIVAANGSGNSLTGGNLNDFFYVKGATTDSFTKIDGLSGDNTLDLSEVIIDDPDPLEINLKTGLCASPCNMELNNINRFVGRKNKQDIITVGCATKYINAQCGWEGRSDQIIIAAKENCRYNLSMQLGSNTRVKNDALTGYFTYFIDRSQKFVSVLATKPRSGDLHELSQAEHEFYINYDLLELEAVEDRAEPKLLFRMIFSFRDRDTKALGPVAISLQNRNVVIVLKDKFAMKLNNKGLYGIQRTNKSLNEIIETYPALVNRVNITLYIEASDAMVIVGSGKIKQNVFHNDAERDTVIVANHDGTSNVFIINNQIKSIFSQITIIAADNQFNKLDLRASVNGIRQLHGEKCLLLHSIDVKSKSLKIDLIEQRTLATLTTITVKNFNNRCDRWLVILNNAPVILKCDEEHLQRNQNRTQILNDYADIDHYTPMPLTFNRTEIIIITPSDIEPNTEIIVRQDIGEYVFTRFDDGLLVTNLIPHSNSTTFIREACSVMLKGFDERPDIFDSITLKFNDRIITMNDLKDDIENAIEFGDWLKEFYNNPPLMSVF